MAHDLTKLEDKTLRQTWGEADGTAYRRTYNVPIDWIKAGELPDEGDPMPGEAAALLGPFIEKDGISFGKQVDGAHQQVIIKSKLLRARGA